MAREVAADGSGGGGDDAWAVTTEGGRRGRRPGGMRLRAKKTEMPKKESGRERKFAELEKNLEIKPKALKKI